MDQKEKAKGDVKFQASKVKLVAMMPEDKEIQENLEETKKNDGYPGSCGV